MKESEENKTLFEKYLNSCFVDIEHSIPRFQQEFFDLQNEYYKMWKNFILTNMTLQKELANKIGITLEIPDTCKKIAETAMVESAKMTSVRNQIYGTWFDTAKKNIKILNDNRDMVMKNYKRIINFWTFSSQKK